MRRTLAIDEKSYGPDHFPRSSNTLSGIQQRPADELFFGGLAGIAEPIGSSTVSVRPDQVHLSADGWCDALPLKVRTDGILRADLVAVHVPTSWMTSREPVTRNPAAMNKWTEIEHVTKYLDRADRIPHRKERERVLLGKRLTNCTPKIPGGLGGLAGSLGTCRPRHPGLVRGCDWPGTAWRLAGV
jgi:hypothetical protein